ncbi:MAG: WhiB family transcriptional regulator, redox-sensing transcriptional regulator [Actinomycetota bacterium]|nr:WhiB family transcriptional regulator, redox-sensing transcriptional regulator [Actinomycetota bacterium]
MGVITTTSNTVREGEWLVEQRRGHRFDFGDRTWQWQANCLGVDPDLFFPERGASTREAKAVCRGCVVRTECLEYALINGEKFGIWGGLSERERRRIRRERTVASREAAASA